MMVKEFTADMLIDELAKTTTKVLGDLGFDEVESVKFILFSAFLVSEFITNNFVQEELEKSSLGKDIIEELNSLSEKELQERVDYMNYLLKLGGKK